MKQSVRSVESVQTIGSVASMARQNLIEGPLTASVIGAFYEVYNTLGFGFLEHIYKAALERELLGQGLKVAREVSVVVMYKRQPLASQRLDMLVEDRLVVEVKSTVDLHAGVQRQVRNYLRSTYLQVGLVLHFGLEAKFYRVVDLHAAHAPMTNAVTDPADQTDLSSTTEP